MTGQYLEPRKECDEFIFTLGDELKRKTQEYFVNQRLERIENGLQNLIKHLTDEKTLTNLEFKWKFAAIVISSTNFYNVGLEPFINK